MCHWLQLSRAGRGRAAGRWPPGGERRPGGKQGELRSHRQLVSSLPSPLGCNPYALVTALAAVAGCEERALPACGGGSSPGGAGCERQQRSHLCHPAASQVLMSHGKLPPLADSRQGGPQGCAAADLMKSNALCHWVMGAASFGAVAGFLVNS